MQPQINRAYELIVGNAVSGEGLQINDLQVTFDISKSSSNKDKTNSASIEIYNLSNDNLKLLDVDYPAAVFSAGYRDIGIKRLFAGQVTNVTTRKSGTDRITQILMGGAYTELNHGVMSSLVAPGRTVKDVAEDIRKALPGVSRSVFNGTNLNNPIIYGYPLQGTPKDMLNELSEKYSLDWQIDDGVLYVHDNDRGNSEKFEDAYVISKYTGLIENAYRASGDIRRSEKDKAKIQAIQMKILLNPDIVPGDIILLEDVLFNGYYKITDMRHTGDWRGQAWYSEIRATAIEKVNRQ
jgi:hypothetical protein